MDFLGIGPLELLVILIIAFIVVGPDRLPQLARSIGKAVQDLRSMSSTLSEEWRQELSVVDDLRAEGREKAVPRLTAGCDAGAVG